MGALPFLRVVYGGILRFFLPWACAGCRRALDTIPDAGFCGRCWLSIPRIQGLVCRFCGIPLKDGGNLCFECRQKPFRICVRAATHYGGPIRPAIHRFKYAGRRSLGNCFNVLMDQAWQRYPELSGSDVLVPVPLHPTSRYDRGYNQAEILAQALGKQVGRPVMPRTLKRSRKTKPQFRLDRSQRLTNLQGAFDLIPETRARLKGRQVLLIDDVCTTGATLLECAKALKKGGAGGVKALVLARDL